MVANVSYSNFSIAVFAKLLLFTANPKRVVCFKFKFIIPAKIGIGQGVKNAGSALLDAFLFLRKTFAGSKFSLGQFFLVAPKHPIKSVKGPVTQAVVAGIY